MTTVFFNRDAWEQYRSGYETGRADAGISASRYYACESTDDDYILGYDDGYDYVPCALLHSSVA